ncbi:hypothetical protein B0H10DRAFT_1967001 [Mycena sp. CBHHK59/15]|nr:hypothetical protein B0H10DRAFT_1967001 [Mycena sp. CBHHK59/15]
MPPTNRLPARCKPSAQPAAAPANDPGTSCATRSNRRNPEAAEAEAPPLPPPSQLHRNQDNTLGFAPLTFPMQPRPADWLEEKPVRTSSTPSGILQTPGHAAANRLLSRLNQQAQMASPGPPTRNQSDSESDPKSDFEDEEEALPPSRHACPRNRAVPSTAAPSEPEDADPVPSRPSRNRDRVAAVDDTESPWPGRHGIDGKREIW